MKYYLIVALLTLSISTSAEEVRGYDILVAGIKIGELTASRDTQDSVTIYSLSSSISFWFLGRINVKHSIVSSYASGKLISSYVETMSSRGNYKSSVVWKDDHYNVSVDAYQHRKDTIISAPIHFNVARLYFEEPQEITSLLADTYGEIVSSSRMGEKSYQVISNGSKNKFYYYGGEMQKAIMHNPIKNFEIRHRQ